MLVKIKASTAPTPPPRRYRAVDGAGRRRRSRARRGGRRRGGRRGLGQAGAAERERDARGASLGGAAEAKVGARSRPTAEPRSLASVSCDSRDCRDALTTPQRARLDWLLAGVSVAHSCSSDPVTRSTRLPSSRLRPCPLILRPCTCATVRSKFITCSWLRRGGGAVAHQRPSQGTLRSVKACTTVAACGVLRSTGGSVLRTPPSPTKYRCDQRESAPSDLAPASTPALGFASCGKPPLIRYIQKDRTDSE